MKATLLLLLPLLTLPACLSGKPPIYGPLSCLDEDDHGTGMVPYVTPNSSAVTCLPPEAAVFMMCVRELSIQTLSDSRASEAKVILPAIKSEPASSEGGGVEVSKKTDYTVVFEDKLSNARAAAIQKCIDVSDVAKKAVDALIVKAEAPK